MPSEDTVQPVIFAVILILCINYISISVMLLKESESSNLENKSKNNPCTLVRHTKIVPMQ